MDVRMPDGTIIRNVPEGTTKAQLQSKLKRAELMRSKPAEYDPASPEYQQQYGAGGSVLEGVGRGMVNVGRQVANMAGLDRDSQASAFGIPLGLDAAAKTDRDLMSTTAGKVGSFTGEIAATAPLAFGAVGALARTGQTAAKALSNPLARGVTEGAMQGSIMAGPDDRAEGALYGGVVGAALPAVGGAYRAVSQGAKRTPAAQKLINEGISLTPGQMNPGGILSHIEEAWQSVPVAGTIIRGARQGAQEQFQRAAIQRAAAPGAKIAQADTAKMLDDAYQSFQPLYAPAKGHAALPKVGNDTLETLFERAARNEGIRATTQTRKSTLAWLQNKLTEIPDHGSSSDDLLKLRSQVRSEIRKEARKAVPDDGAIEIMEQAEKALTRSVESQIPRDAVASLQQADRHYGTYKLLEDAVRRGGDQPGGFTPAQFSQAVRAVSDRGRYARGGGNLRDLSAAGREVFTPTQVPTGQRLAAIASPAALAAAEPLVGGSLGAGMLGLIGTRTGRKLAAGEAGFQKILQAINNNTVHQLSPAEREIAALLARRASVSGGLLAAE